MYMTVSKISRKDASMCTTVDLQTIVPSMHSWDAYWNYLTTKQGEGKVIYRSASINDNGEMETVTLYLAKEDYDTFKADPVWDVFETALLAIYNPPVVTVEFI